MKMITYIVNMAMKILIANKNNHKNDYICHNYDCKKILKMFIRMVNVVTNKNSQ